jgi:glycosyltransferase involved in cell wall biosynthesis
MGKEKLKLKGIYLVPDAAMMKPNFGPSEHIRVGMNELKKYFDIELIVLGEINSNFEQNKPFKIMLNKNGFVGLLRDIKLLYNSNKGKRELTRKIIEKGDIDFIYERGQYLDFRGIRCAKELGIKHFYEVNWINYLGIKQFYYSWFNSLAKRLEEWSYSYSHFNFIVGSQNTLIKIDEKKFRIIQNGMYKSVFDQNNQLINEKKGKLKIVYVANLMPHHRFDLLIEALNMIKSIDDIELHFIGYNFQEHFKSLPKNLKYIFHGHISQNEIHKYLSNANVGIITGGPSYSSFMKLFEYSAYKLAVICPDLENVKKIFSDDEVLFFENNSNKSLAYILENITCDFHKVKFHGEKLYEKSKKCFTWENIYLEISSDIKKRTN